MLVNEIFTGLNFRTTLIANPPASILVECLVDELEFYAYGNMFVL